MKTMYWPHTCAYVDYWRHKARSMYMRTSRFLLWKHVTLTLMLNVYVFFEVLQTSVLFFSKLLISTTTKRDSIVLQLGPCLRSGQRNVLFLCRHLCKLYSFFNYCCDVTLGILSMSYEYNITKTTILNANKKYLQPTQTFYILSQSQMGT